MGGGTAVGKEGDGGAKGDGLAGEGRAGRQRRVIRRKVAANRQTEDPGNPGADRAWRLALARAARDRMKLALDVDQLTIDRLSLAELLELPPAQSMLIVLEGPQEGLGLVILSPPVLAAMVEMQTIGRLAPVDPAARKPTRTDAAMIVPVIDQALAGLEAGLQDQADLVWAGGFRYASFLDDPRPLGLLLEDGDYRVLRASLSLGGGIPLGGGLRQGGLILALPFDGRGVRPAHLSEDPPTAAPDFAERLADRVAGAVCPLDAVLTRISLPLAEIAALAVGGILALPQAGLERIRFEGGDASVLAEGKLGQNHGMRAVRLQARGPTPVVEAAEAPAIPPLRAVG